MKILALSGSLRERSYNTWALEAASNVAPEGGDMALFHAIGELPLFNPDLEDYPIPSVAELKSAVGSACGLVVASPAYAHGISGVMKNALDWLVSGEEFVSMPVMLISAHP